MKFLALLFTAAVAGVTFTAACESESGEIAREDVEPMPSIASTHSHSEYLVQPTYLTASRGHSARASFKASSPNAIWMRAMFGEEDLPEDVIVTVRSVLDGDSHRLDATSLREWGFHSAFLNGNELEVIVESTTEASVPVVGFVVGENPLSELSPDSPDSNFTTRSLCDWDLIRRRDQSRPNDARFMLTGSSCTAYLIDDEFGCFLTAGHCVPDANSVFQFNVPDSNPSGGLVNPPAEFQFPVDVSSSQGVSDYIGNDWQYVGSMLNPAGRTPREQMGTIGYTLSNVTTEPVLGDGTQGFGYGVDYNHHLISYALKGSWGPVVEKLDGVDVTTVSYRVSTTSGDSGSAITLAPPGGGSGDGPVIAIHSHGGCYPCGGGNHGTWVQHPDVQAALANPRGVCLTGH